MELILALLLALAVSYIVYLRYCIDRYKELCMGWRIQCNGLVEHIRKQKKEKS